MKRLLRVLWVFAANSFVAWMTFSRFSSETFMGPGALDPQVFIEIILELPLPVFGIALELFGWRSARWLNIGYLLVAGCFWLGSAVRWHSDPFFGVLAIMSLMMFVLAGLTEMIYRWTQTQPKAEPSVDN